MINRVIVSCHALPSPAYASLRFWESLLYTIPQPLSQHKYQGRLSFCAHTQLAQSCYVKQVTQTSTGLCIDNGFRYILEGHGEDKLDREENNACAFSGRDTEGRN
jgi:hypothetical protein